MKYIFSFLILKVVSKYGISGIGHQYWYRYAILDYKNIRYRYRIRISDWYSPGINCSHSVLQNHRDDAVRCNIESK